MEGRSERGKKKGELWANNWRNMVSKAVRFFFFFAKPERHIQVERSNGVVLFMFLDHNEWRNWGFLQQPALCHLMNSCSTPSPCLLLFLSFFVLSLLVLPLIYCVSYWKPVWTLLDSVEDIQAPTISLQNLFFALKVKIKGTLDLFAM